MNGTAIGKYAPDFELPGVHGNVHHLYRYLERYRAVVVVFLSNECPQSRHYLARLNELVGMFRDRGVGLVGINPNQTESFESMKAFAAERNLKFPYLRDVTQDVAQCFGASVTPEAFLIDGEGVLRYHGQIDDAPDSAEDVKHPYLQDALEALLGDRPIETAQTTPQGCSIVWRKSEN